MESDQKLIDKILHYSHLNGLSAMVPFKTRVTPVALKQAIHDALVRNVRTDAEVHGSKAILKGTVRSRAEKEEVQRTVWSSPGINSVENQLRIHVDNVANSWTWSDRQR